MGFIGFASSVSGLSRVCECFGKVDCRQLLRSWQLMFHLITFCLLAVCLSCGSENQLGFISGSYELFMGVDVSDGSC